MLFSTSHAKLSVQPLSARIPIRALNRAQWTNYTLDMIGIINDIWRNQTFKSIDSISVGANCKLRKIFTLKSISSAQSGFDFDDGLSQVNFVEGTNAKFQVKSHCTCFVELFTILLNL